MQNRFPTVLWRRTESIFLKGEKSMTEYEKGYHDAQRAIAIRYYHCYLEDFMFEVEFKKAAKIIGISFDDMKSVAAECQRKKLEEFVDTCLAESDSLEEKIYRLYIEDFRIAFIQKRLGVTEEKVGAVIEGKDHGEVAHTIYQKLKQKKELNNAEYRYYRSYSIGFKIGLEKVHWEYVHKLHEVGLDIDLIAKILERPREDVERLLKMKKEEIRDWAEAHWRDEDKRNAE